METLYGMMAMQKQVELVNAKVRTLSDSLNTANKENDALAAQKTGLMVQLGKVEKERDSLRKETDSLQDERNALQLEKSVWHTEREFFKAENEELLRLLSDEQSAWMAFEKRALD
ncbi:spindle pole body protein pcp1-like [Cornus florida]|uniref:spindle pole body protein pcp1-like n=1 Tax=Cornus florida TaxID=4283 RepID=UPI00289B829A|nr:spindle pole body protein pcp1-like [Cornus florida]